MNSFMQIKKGILLIGETSATIAADVVIDATAYTKEGAMWVNSTTNLLRTYIQGAERSIVTDTQIQTLTNKTLSGASMASVTSGTGTFTFNTTGTITVPNTTDTLVTLTGTQTLTNKTLTAPTIATILNGGTLTLPTSTDTLVGRNTTDTLTNKTLTLPIMSTINSGGNTLTLPIAVDTLVGRATTDTLTNKSISGLTNSLTNIPLGAAVTGVLPVANGGTSLSSGNAGGILSFTSSSAIASSPTLTVSQLIIGGGAGSTPSTLAAGTQYQSLIMGATIPGYGAVNLAQPAAITGILPIANGGTGTTTTSAAFNAFSPMTTLGDMIYGGASGAGTRLGIGSANQVLTVSGGLPIWATFTALTNPMTTGGDIIYGGASGTPTRLANGTNGQFLTSSGGTSAPTWTTFTVPIPTVQRFTSSSGTYTTPAGVRYIRVRMVGGGAGGSGSGASPISANGAAGADTTFGTLTAGGAPACLSPTNGGAGGSGGTNTLTGFTDIASRTGNSGGGYGFTALAGDYPRGGIGAGTPFIGSVAQGLGNLSGGANGPVNSGGGGSGGGGGAGVNTYSGNGAGSGGYVEVQSITLSATYAYSVGAGGAGGAAGGSGAAGGNGGSGIIIVEEYYV